MPLLKHAKKKLKQDKKRTIRNKKVKTTFKESVKKAKVVKTEKTISAAFQAIDKAAKKHLIHKNKAARMKSALSKLVNKGAKKTAEVKPAAKAAPAKVKSPVKKTAPKKAKK